MAALAGALALNACAETELAINTAKRIAPGTSESTTASQGSTRSASRIRSPGAGTTRSSTPTTTGPGSPPGTGRSSMEADRQRRNLRQERADRGAQTLPLPSIVRVTNLRNGREVKLRVNDRGPFVNGRMIDVSRRAAQLLGFAAQGIAPVRVEVDGRRKPPRSPAGTGRAATRRRRPTAGHRVIARRGAGRRAAEQLAPGHLIAASSRSAPNRSPPTSPQAGQRHVRSGRRLRPARLCDPPAAPLLVERAGAGRRGGVGERRFYRVRLGPMSTGGRGDRQLERVLASGTPALGW